MSTETIKCPNCGGPLHFEPEIQKNKCDYCLSEFTNEELREINAAATEDTSGDTSEAHDHSHVHEHTQDENIEEHLAEYTCDSCGAQVVTEETTATTFCYYCHNPVILIDRISGEFRPDKVIPFTFSREKAINSFTNWAKSYSYVPKSFYSSSQLEKMTGMYVPNWMAETESKIDFQGEGTRLKVWRAGDLEYTEHKKYALNRQGEINVGNITEIALRKIDHSLLSTIAPYDESKAVDFEVAYLNGFFSEKYDIKKDDLKKVIEDRALSYTENLVKDSLSGYDRTNFVKSSIEPNINKWTYILLPVWIMTYKYNGKTYIYAINGQTGKSFGELPLDNKKLSFTTVAIALAVLILLLIGGSYIW